MTKRLHQSELERSISGQCDDILFVCAPHSKHESRGIFDVTSTESELLSFTEEVCINLIVVKITEIYNCTGFIEIYIVNTDMKYPILATILCTLLIDQILFKKDFI